MAVATGNLSIAIVDAQLRVLIATDVASGIDCFIFVVIMPADTISAAAPDVPAAFVAIGDYMVCLRAALRHCFPLFDGLRFCSTYIEQLLVTFL